MNRAGQPWHAISITLLIAFLSAITLLAPHPLIATAQSGDTTPPVLTAFTFVPASINTDSGDATITVSAQATDDLTGVCANPDNSSGCVPLQAHFVNQSSGQNYNVVLDLVAGTYNDGTFRGTITFPEYSASGAWDVQFVVLSDANGNLVYIYEPELNGKGFQTQLTNTGSIQDVTPPVLTAFSFAPTSIDTDSGDATVTVTAQAKDDLTGVCANPDNSSGCVPLQVHFANLPTGQSYDAVLDLTSGTYKDGTFEGQLTFPRYTAAGTWDVQRVAISDKIGNLVYLSESDLTSKGFSTQLVINSSGDTTPPVLSAFSFSPVTINTANAPATINVSAQATDDLTGVCANPSNSSGCVPLQAHFGNLSTGQSHDVVLDLVAGTYNNGTFEGQLTFPRYSAPGIWILQRVAISDKIGNLVYLFETDLTAKGFSTTLTNANTFPGSNVTVIASNPDGTPSGITLTLASVTDTGYTTSTTTQTGPALPQGYIAPSTPAYYDINTTVAYSLPLTVCIQYDPAQYGDPNNVRLLHYANNGWSDVTTSNDTNDHILCGEVTSLSPFVVVQKKMYTFSGFYPPVDNLPTINIAKAGQAIPIRWSLKKTDGSFVSDLGMVVSYGYGTVTCGSGTTDTIEEYSDAGLTSLRYDTSANQFVLTSKTNKTWAGSCKTFTLTLSDGTKHQASFQFK